jgi:hypothetical protein
VRKELRAQEETFCAACAERHAKSPTPFV